jgi:thiosulfate dehydrogenase [quinone] large subunit
MKYSNSQTAVLLLFRIVLGYHFLFEGIDKLLSPGWTSSIFLLQTNWFLSDFYHSIANNGNWLLIVDSLNIWGQILIGISLIIGLFSKYAAYSGAFLLLIYYFSIPPFMNTYLFIDKNLIELFAFLVVAIFPTSHIIGIDILIQKLRKGKNG